MVLGVKSSSDENPLMFWVRKKYYRLVNRLSVASKPSRTSPASGCTTAR